MAYWLYCTACQQWSKSATPLSDDKTCSFCNNYFIGPQQTVDSVSDSLIVDAPEGSQDSSAIPEIPEAQAVDTIEGAEAPVTNEMPAPAAENADEVPGSSATTEDAAEAEPSVTNGDTNETRSPENDEDRNESESSINDEDANESDPSATDEDAEEPEADETDGDQDTPEEDETAEEFELPVLSESDDPDTDAAQEVSATPEAQPAPAPRFINRTKRRTRKTH